MSDSFTKDFNNMTGKLLISKIEEDDALNQVFYRAVMLIIQTDADNVYGINLAHQLKDKVYSGGPEESFTVLSPGKEDWRSVSNADFANYLITRNNDDIPAIRTATQEEIKKMFLGSASWSPAQLSTEIDYGVWKAIDATEELVFNTEAEDLYDVGLRVARMTQAPRLN